MPSYTGRAPSRNLIGGEAGRRPTSGCNGTASRTV